MSVLANLTPEQIAAFESCTTKEEIAAKAKELGLEPTEADLDEAVALLSKETGELTDDALDAVAGGKKLKKCYEKVKKGTQCVVPQYYEPCPPDQYRWKDDQIGMCGTCVHCHTIDGTEVCVKRPKD